MKATFDKSVNVANRLSPIDHVFTGRGAYPINFAFVYNGLLDSAKLRKCLDEVLEDFPPLSSRLKVHEENTYILEHKVSCYTWNLQKSETDPTKASLQEMMDSLECAKSIPGEPLLKITLTHFRDKSCLGISISHCVGDGHSYFMFLMSWVSRFWGKDYVKPVIDRNVLTPESVLLISPTPDQIFANTGLSFSSQVRLNEKNNLGWEIFDFNGQEIEDLYLQTSSQIATRLSKNDVMTAYIWKKFVDRHHVGSDKLANSCAYDYRKMFSKIDERYFGNAVLGSSFEIDSDEFKRLSLAELSERISINTKAVNEQSVINSLQCLESFRLRNGLHKLSHLHVANPDFGFIVTNLSKLPINLLNFGLGAPIDFRFLTHSKRAAAILPLPSGGIRVQMGF